MSAAPTPVARRSGSTSPRSGAPAVVLIAISVALQVVVGHLGPSVAVPPVSPRLDPHPLANGWLVTGLLAVALTGGGVGVLLGLTALRGGWRPAPRRLLAGAALGVLVLLIGPPLGTADLGGYAAYGRMSVLDRDPYATTPQDLAGDPVADAAEEPWRTIPSIYGPLATAEFRVAAVLGGDSRQAVLRLLQVASGLAFVATGLLLDRHAARAGPGARRRAALLWSANPLLLYQLVAGAHLDSLLALLVAAGVLLAEPSAVRGRWGRGRWGRGRWRSSWWGSVASGAVFGVAGLVKATAAAPAAGVAVAQLLDRTRPGARRGSSLQRAGGFVVAGVVVAAVGYAAVGGLSALTPTRDASRFVSRGTPWRFVASGLEQVMPHDTARTIVGLLALVAAVLLAVHVTRALPAATPAIRAALGASVAWLVLAPYSLPWYDAIGWALLALFVVGGPVVVRVEALLLLHTAFLSVAYLPGRVVGLTDGITTAQDVVRGILAPVVVVFVALGLARLPKSGTAGGPALGGGPGT